MERTKTPEKIRLGRGLAALIPPSASAGRGTSPTPTAEEEEISMTRDINIASIVPNPYQPRTEFDASALADLAASIAAHGVLQPVMVRPQGGGRYELVAGERRFRAAQQAGLTQIPAVVREMSDEDALVVALIENIQREDLNPVEAARGYRQLMQQFHLTQMELAKQIGKAQPTIAHALGLLKLPDEIQATISDGQLSAEHGKLLLAISDKAQQKQTWQTMLSTKPSRQQARELVEEARSKSQAAAKGRKTRINIEWRALEDQFRTALGLKVALKPGAGGRGTLTVTFSNAEEMEAFLEKIQ